MLVNDDSQLTPAPSFGKMSNDQHGSSDPKSASKAASDYTGGGNYHAKHIGTHSSISGSVGGGDKGWSE